jgi:hypothetical protein
MRCSSETAQTGCGALALLAALLALGACAPRPFARAEVIAGGDRTVSIKAGQWSNTESLANAHCRKFGKRAIARGRTRLSERDLTDLFVYDCEPDHR